MNNNASGRNGYINGPWIDPHVECLKRLWIAGDSASVIAGKLNRQFNTAYTRNAVIGKVSRLMLPARKAKSGEDAGVTARRIYKRKAAVAKAQARISRLSAIFQADSFVPSAEEIIVPVHERKTIATLEKNDCRWPIGDPQHSDFHFCGRSKVPGLSYCPDHVRRCYEPPRGRRLFVPVQAKLGFAKTVPTKETVDA